MLEPVVTTIHKGLVTVRCLLLSGRNRLAVGTEQDHLLVTIRLLLTRLQCGGPGELFAEVFVACL